MNNNQINATANYSSTSVLLNCCNPVRTALQFKVICPQNVTVRVCLNFIRPGWNRRNGTRLFVVVRSIPSCFVSILNFQATEQPTRTENNPTDFCGGTAQLDPTAGVGAVTWATSALDTENGFSCKYSAKQASEQAVLAIPAAPSGKL